MSLWHFILNARFDYYYFSNSKDSLNKWFKISFKFNFSWILIVLIVLILQEESKSLSTSFIACWLLHTDRAKIILRDVIYWSQSDVSAALKNSKENRFQNVVRSWNWNWHTFKAEYLLRFYELPVLPFSGNSRRWMITI